jgi:hypothetical protein
LGRFGSDESKEKYARLIAERFASGPRRTISLAVGEVLSIAALVVKYDDHATTYYRKNGEPTSQVERIRSAVRPLVKLYGSTPAAEFSPTKLQQWERHWSNLARNGGAKKESGQFPVTAALREPPGQLCLPGFGITPRHNVLPGQLVPVVRGANHREIVQLRWGLIPSWSKGAKIAFFCLSARADKVKTKPAFRSAFKSRRCLPADS